MFISDFQNPCNIEYPLRLIQKIKKNEDSVKKIGL